MALDGSERSTARPGRFTPGERSIGIHCTGVSVGTRAGLTESCGGNIIFLASAGLRTTNRPACSRVTIQTELSRLQWFRSAYCNYFDWTTRRSRHRWVVSVKIGRKDAGYDRVNRIYLPEGREHCEPVIKSSDSIKYGIFLTSYCIVSSCRLVKY
jgi:hypothetical protein